MKTRMIPGTSALVLAGLLAGAPAAPAAPATDDADLAVLKQTSRAFAQVARRAMPAVVFIQVSKDGAPAPGMRGMPPGMMPGLPNDDVFEWLFRGRRGPDPDPRPPLVGQGTGFLITEDGYILTNHHIVREARRIRVTLHDGREFDAEFVGSDSRSDVAVVRIKGSGFPVIALGDSDRLDIGEWVVAIGNPFGLSATLTVGVVSAKGRNNIGITDYEDFIQTDAAINPGNSGGPLLNTAGEVVGINTAIFSQTGGSLGIGFAIPINMARAVKDQLIASGKVDRGYLGVRLQDLTAELTEALGLSRRRGALVSEVVRESPAAAAGLKPGDVIVELDGKPVENASDVRNAVGMRAAGAALTVKALRDGKPVELRAVVGSLEKGERAEAGGAAAAAAARETLGLAVEPLTEEWAGRTGFEPGSGVLVTSVQAGSPAYRMGLQPGNLVQSVNHQPVRTVDEFYAAVDKAARDGMVLLLVRDSRGSRFVAWRLR